MPALPRILFSYIASPAYVQVIHRGVRSYLIYHTEGLKGARYEVLL